MREHKTLALTEFKVTDNGDAGEFTGRASTFGTVDSYGDTVDPGAYTDTLPEFRTRGFIGWGHDWDEPIGYVTSAEERSDGLYISGKFHTDPESQRRRQIAKERLDNGLFMGLSIGYEALETAERQVDPPVRSKWGGFTDKVRALTKIKLYEVSLVMVPAESSSGLTGIKGHDVSVKEHAAQLTASFAELLARAEAGIAKDIKAGRAVSASRLQQWIEAIDGLESASTSQIAKLRAIIAEVSESGTDESETEPVVGLSADDDPKSAPGMVAAIPEDLREWVERYHKLQRAYGSD